MSYLCSSCKLRFTLLSAFVFITVLALAQNADFSINNASQCQTGNSFYFTNLSSGGTATYQWSFGDGTTSTATNPTKTYSASGNYSVQLIATIGGTDHYASKTVSVNPLPQCSFSYLVATGTGNSYTFQSNSTIASGGMSYSWDFGDGVSGSSSNPGHTYVSTGSYNVTLTVTSDQGCVCSTTQSIAVTVSSSTSVCPDSLYSFCVNELHQCVMSNSFLLTNTSHAPSGTTFSWNFGDGTGSTLASPSKTYTTPGTYIITLTSTYSGTSCYSTKTVVVENSPVVTISGGNCVGNTLTANITGTNISNLNWVNGSGIVSSDLPTWSTTGQVVAGGNGAGTMVYPVPIGVVVNQLTIPKGIYLNNNKDLYIIDNYTSRVVKWPTGNTSGISKCYSTQITGIGEDCNGNIYTSDDVNNWVQKWTPGATTGIIVAGGNGAGSAANQLNNPRGNLFIDNSGNIYINDTYNSRIQMWAPGATTGVTVAGGNGAGSAMNQLYNPHGFFVDDAGNIYVTDAGNFRILKFPAGSTSATNGVLVAGGNGMGMGLNQFNYPFSVFVDKAGNIYVDDNISTANNHRIQLWAPGTTTGITILNVPGSYSDDAIANVWVDINNGDIYVSDDANSRVMKYPVSGISTTYIPTAAGTYSIVATSFDGCSSSNSVNLNNYNAVQPITGQNSVCVGNTISLSDSSTGGVWSSSSNGIATVDNTGIVTGVSAGVDTIKYKVSSSCGDTTAIYIIQVNPLPVVAISNNGGVCSGNDTLHLTGASSASEIVWYKNGVATDTTNASFSDSAVTVARTNGLNALYVDKKGDIYETDVNGSGWRILEYPAGTSDSIVLAGSNGDGNAANQFSDPWGVFVDASGNLYVSDYVNNRIQKFPPGSTSATNAVTVAGGNGQGAAANQLNMPYGVFVDLNGNMYVADAGNNRIMKYKPGSTTGVVVAGGNGMGSAANQLNNPFGVWVDNNGYIYVADGANNRIQKFPPGSTSATNGVTVAGGNGMGSALNQFTITNNVFVDPTGNVYVTDDNNRILMFPAGSTSSTNGVVIAGNNGRGSAPNQFSHPSGVFTDSYGNLYVGDEGNQRVQKFAHIIDTNQIVSSSGNYTAVVTNYYGCNTTSNTINIGSSVVTPSFTINAASQCLNGNSFSFTNTSSSCSTASYLWNFGDGTTSTATNPIKTYTSAGSYNVTLKATYAGVDYYYSQTVVVGATPVASFNILAGTGSGNAYTFISTSTINSGYISSYSWDFGDGATASVSNPNHTYAANGTYNVKLVVTSNGGCKDSIIQSVLVTLSDGGGTPLPSFTVNNTQQCFNGNSFVFTNTSSAPTGTTYLWNFGDGATATTLDAFHTYTSAGNYNVTLIATYNGIDHYYAQTVIVNPMPVSGFNYFANKQTIYDYTFLSTSTIASGNMTYLWNFGDGTTDSISNPEHNFNADCSKVITLTVTSDAGCKDSTVHTIIFNSSLPHASIALHIPTPIISPALEYYYDISYASTSSVNCGNIISSQWDISSYDVWTGLYSSPFYTDNIYGNKPTITDSTYKVTISVGTLDPQYQFRLIVTTDMGTKDTAYAFFGNINSGFTTFRNPANNMNIMPDATIGVYPNPAVQETNIVAQVDKYTVGNLIVYNTIGQVVVNNKVSIMSNIKQSVNLNISNWSEGLYYVLLKDNQGNIIGKSKFIKTIK